MLNAKILLASMLATFALNSAASAAEHNELLVHASGFKHAAGHAVAKLFQPGDDVLGKGRWQLVAPIQDGRANFQFFDLPTGAYALIVFHDENDNGEIDHNLLHLPSEELGFSNGFVPGLVTGLPSFDKLRFEHADAMQRMEVTVK